MTQTSLWVEDRFYITCAYLDQRNTAFNNIVQMVLNVLFSQQKISGL